MLCSRKDLENSFDHNLDSDTNDILKYRNLLISDGKRSIRAICDFMDKNGGESPNKRSMDIEESRLGIKLSNLKTAKQGKGITAWDKEYLALAKKRGYPNLFNINK